MMIPRNVNNFSSLMSRGTLDNVDLRSEDDKQKIMGIFLNLADSPLLEKSVNDFSALLLQGHSGAREFTALLREVCGLSTASLEENQRELAEMIYHGTLINGTNAHLQEQLPRFLHLVRQVAPFASDSELIEACERFHDPDQLRSYFTALQATMCYQPFQQYNPGGLIRPTKQVKDLISSEQHNESLVTKYRFLSEEHNPPLVSVQIVRGDGNCYYRSVVRSHLENAMLAGDPDRKALFEHMAALLRDELFKDGSLYRRDHPDLASLAAVVNRFEDAANGRCWRDLQELSHDLSVEGEGGLDYILIEAVRYCMSQYLIEHLDMDLNGISFQDLLFSEMPAQASQPTEEQKHVYLQQYIKDHFLTMGQDAEGACVYVGLLPAMIGSNVNNILVDRGREQDLLELPTKATLAPAFIERYNMGTLPKTEGNLLLRPGHYDYFNTEKQQQDKFRMLAESPVKPFNFTGNPLLTTAWISEYDEESELRAALALSLATQSRPEDGDTDSELSSASSPELRNTRLDALLSELMVVPLSYTEAYDFRHDTTRFDSVLSHIIQDAELTLRSSQMNTEQQTELSRALGEFISWVNSHVRATENSPLLQEKLVPLVHVSATLQRGLENSRSSSPTSSVNMKQRLRELSSPSVSASERDVNKHPFSK